MTMATATASKSTSSKGSGVSGFRPLHDKILVRRDKADDKTESGLYLPEKAKETPRMGTVEAVGTGSLNKETGELIALTVKKGDRVLFSSYAGSELKLNGEEFLVMSEEEVLAIVED
jgi:chaperonin GroES